MSHTQDWKLEHVNTISANRLYNRCAVLLDAQFLWNFMQCHAVAGGFIVPIMLCSLYSNGPSITGRLAPPPPLILENKLKNPLALTEPRSHVLLWLDQILHDKCVVFCGWKGRLSSKAATSFWCSPNKEAAGIMPSCAVPTQRGSEEKSQNGWCCLFILTGLNCWEYNRKRALSYYNTEMVWCWIDDSTRSHVGLKRGVVVWALITAY